MALNKPVTTGNPASAASASNAVDGNLTQFNYWSGSEFPDSVLVDLLDVYDLSSVHLVNYYGENRYYHYNIEASVDGVNWTQIANKTNNQPSTQAGVTYSLSNTSARYLRANMTYNSANAWVHVVEFEAYGVLLSDSDPDPPSQPSTTLVNKNSAQCIDNGGLDLNSDLYQAVCDSSDEQDWIFNAVVAKYEIVSANSNLCIQLEGSATNNDANVVQQSCDQGDDQLWDVIS